MADTKIRNWLMAFPGMFEGADSAEVLQKAHTASGVGGGVAEFKAALDRAGFRVDQVRQTYRLVLPARPVSASGRSAHPTRVRP